MVILKKTLLLSGLLIYIAIGLMLKSLLWINPALGFKIISNWTRLFNQFLRLILRIRVIVEGEPLDLKEGGNFIISNHLSYLDGVVLGSLFAVVYVSKSQVRKWPLFGWMTQVAGTIFIDRQRKIKSPDYIQETIQILRRKVNVLVFPEGTSSSGERLLPFQSVHFQSPLNSRGAILPVEITYTKINEAEANLKNKDRVCWYGQINFYQHLCQVLELKNIEARVTIHPKIYLGTFLKNSYSRKDLSEMLHSLLAYRYPLFK